MVKLEDNALGGVSCGPGQLRISDPAIKRQIISKSGFRAGAKTDSDKGFRDAVGLWCSCGRSKFPWLTKKVAAGAASVTARPGSR